MRPQLSIDREKQEIIRILSAMDEVEYRRASEIARRVNISFPNVQKCLFHLGQRAVEFRLTSKTMSKNGQRVYEYRRRPGALELFVLRRPGVAARVGL